MGSHHWRTSGSWPLSCIKVSMMPVTQARLFIKNCIATYSSICRQNLDTHIQTPHQIVIINMSIHIKQTHSFRFRY